MNRLFPPKDWFKDFPIEWWTCSKCGWLRADGIPFHRIKHWKFLCEYCYQKENNMKWILKVLIGSRAHGLNTEQSDYDYRGVFIQPTEEILSLGGKVKTTHWIEGKELDKSGRIEDDTAWEIGHFLQMATQCNPTILEVFSAPVVNSTGEGLELRSLFSYFLDAKKIATSFIGYGHNQRKKLLEDKDDKPNKFASAYLRVLIQAEELLNTGNMRVDMRDHKHYDTLLDIRNNKLSHGEIIDICIIYEDLIRKAETKCKFTQSIDKINEFLVNIRKSYWNI